MAYQEYVQKAIATNKSYDDLPAKVRGAIPLQEWKARLVGGQVDMKGVDWQA